MAKKKKAKKDFEVPIQIHNPIVQESTWIPVIEVTEFGEDKGQVDVHWPDDEKCEYKGKLDEKKSKLPGFYRISYECEAKELVAHRFKIPGAEDLPSGALVTVMLVETKNHTRAVPIWKL